MTRKLSAILFYALMIGGAAADDDLSSKTQNPIGAMISVPFEHTVDFGAPNGQAYVMSFQPVIPVRIGDWNLVSRPIIPLANIPGGGINIPPIIPPSPGAMGGGRPWGIGDLNYSLFFSPANAGKLIWGVGPAVQAPTATDSRFGAGKWAAGPTAVFLTQPKPWSIGILLRQMWSFAGSSGRPDINQFVAQPFVSYNLEDGWYLTTSPVLVANWDTPSSQRWTVPLGGGVGRIMNFGEQPVNLKVEAYYNAVRPDAAPTWAAKFTTQFLFPK